MKLEERMQKERALKVTLDACIIFPLAACDTLLHASEAGLYTPIWSTAILEEVFRTSRNVLHPHKYKGLSKRIADMNNSFPNAVVDSPIEAKTFPPHLLPDPDDAHVIATAVVSKSNFIVTENLKDFPEKLLASLGINAISFDNFMSYLFDVDANAVQQALTVLTLEKDNPPITVLEHLFKLEPLSPNFNKKVRERLASHNGS
ncbi:MAG: PIN domain-containing protein [Micrococcales bacterium]|nr:PIN domain-containing protein [Micrococcales bacterium]